MATLLEDQSHRATDPAAARELAREMRQRATIVEAGEEVGQGEEWVAQTLDPGVDRVFWAAEEL